MLFEPCQKYCAGGEADDVDEELLVVFVEINCKGTGEVDAVAEVLELITFDVDVDVVNDVVTLAELVKDLVLRASGPKTSMVIGLLKEANLPVSG